MSNSATQWTVVRQAPLSMEFSRQEYWSGLSLPTPEDLPNPVIKPESPWHLLHWQVDSLPLVPPGKSQTSQFSHSVVSNSLRTYGPKSTFTKLNSSCVYFFLLISSSSFPKPAKGTTGLPFFIFLMPDLSKNVTKKKIHR